MTDKTHFDVFDYQKLVMEQMMDNNRKLTKAFELMMGKRKVEIEPTPHDMIFQLHQVKVLHYHSLAEKTEKIPIVLIFALLNRPYILDLVPDKSVVRTLLKLGYDVYMIDWGAVTPEDKFLTIDDYVNRYIHKIIDVIKEDAGVPQVSILGYCMGGTLSVMYSSLHPENVKNLLVMASPIDFEADKGTLRYWADKKYFDVDKVVDIMGNVPPEFLNAGFLLLDPFNNLYGKYAKMVDVVDNDEIVDLFLRMEKWIFDGIPIAGETYREFLKNGYQNNQLIKNQWKLNGRTVNLKNINMPLCLIVADFDTLVPKESTLSLMDAVSSKDKKLFTLPKGHIGLSVSGSAHKHLWPQVGEWLRERSSITPIKSRKPKTKQRKLQSVKGIGPSYLKKLKAAGVTTTKELLDSDSKELSGVTGIPAKRIIEWQESLN